MKQMIYLLACLFLTACSPTAKPIALARSQAKASNADQSEAQVATSRAEQKYSTPKRAFRTFVEAVVDGNIEQAKSAVVMNDEVERYLLAKIDFIRAIDEFAVVDNEHFGTGGMPIKPMRRLMLSGLDEIEPAMINGSRAECMALPPTAHPMILVRLENEWKVDFSDKTPERLLKIAPPVFRKAVIILDGLRQRILDGDITSREETRKELRGLINVYGL